MDNFETIDDVCEDSSQNQSKSNMMLEDDSFDSDPDSESDSYSNFDSNSSTDSCSPFPIKFNSVPCSLNRSGENTLLKEYQAASTPTPHSLQFSDQSNKDVKIVDRHAVEKSSINAMYARKCCVKYCITVISRNVAEMYRNMFQLYSEKEQELVIKAHLVYSRQNFEFLDYYKSKRTNIEALDIHHRKTLFYFRQIQICKKFYLFLHDLEYTRYKQIVGKFDKYELAPDIDELDKKVAAAKMKLNSTI